jgi:putative FmdB family regulatory protein
MPIYEYKCADGHLTEVMLRITDDPITACEVCGAPVERVFHPIAVHFKGSGFYNTDYGTKKRAREQKDSASKESSGSGSETKTETARSESKSGSKSESKSESKPAAPAAKSD